VTECQRDAEITYGKMPEAISGSGSVSVR